MTIAYFDCFSGASGDMIVGALLAAGGDGARLRRELAPLGLAGVEVDWRRIARQGVHATKFDVRVRGRLEPAAPEAGAPHDHAHDHHPEHGHPHGDAHGHHPEEGGHHHRTLADVEALLAPLPEGPRARAVAIFRRLAAAEAAVHGTTAPYVHFHEVGMDDAIVDVAATVLLLDQLGVTEVQCSPLPLGGGMVRCAHGLMPVPVPAVVELLAGVPSYDNGERGELVTPTGAAILTALATRFGPPPAWSLGGVGYGAGTREGKRVPNLLRVMLGEPVPGEGGDLVEMAANIDDLSPQFYGPLVDKLLEAGALDVTLTPTLMKKGRPGIVVTLVAPAAGRETLATLLFRETTTLGLRYHPVSRTVLARDFKTVETPWGAVRVKRGLLGDTVVNVAPEFDDCRRVADAAGQPLKEVWQQALAIARLG